MHHLKTLKFQWENTWQYRKVKKYPKIYRSWSDHWATLSTYFKYSASVRKLIYTSNIIEGFNRQLRKVIKSKTVFSTDNSLLKMMHLATIDITKNWIGRRQDWGKIRSQLEIYFEERLDEKYFQILIFIDIDKNCCIMQSRGRAFKSSAPIVKSTYLMLAFKFTQTLKRSLFGAFPLF